jgi:monoamine oxidase
MIRREFLRRSALAALGLSACSLNIPEAERRALERTGARKRVIVVGAGLAGLAAGYELTQAGHDVTIVEARAYPGGRVHTLREPFADGLYAEAGANFIPDNHYFTLGYVKLFDLPLEPVFPRSAGKLYYVRGQRITLTGGAQVAWPFELTPEEQSLGLSGMWRKYLGTALDEAKDLTAGPLVEKYDRMSAADLLRARGASPGAVVLLGVGYLDLSGDGIESYSALLMLRDLALRRGEKETYAIRGGNDLLPRAFASRLAGRIRYNAPVVRIEHGEQSATVVIRRGTDHERLSGDHVLCTVPCSVLRRLEIAPPLSPLKRAAVEQLPYTSVARVYLQSRRKFWTERGWPTSASTDLPVKWVWEPTLTQPGPRGVLESYSAGPDARRLTARGERDRIQFALEHVERVYPGIVEHFETGVSKAWDEDPWARGAYAFFAPGQISSLLPHLATPEGRLHFAGEHASTWPQWMQGAFESGLRAAREIHEAP